VLAAPAHAAERRWPVGSVERIRIEAPIDVRITTGAGTGVRATGPARAALDTLDVHVDGDTLTIRAPRASAPIGTLTIATPRVGSVALFAPSAVTIDTLRGDRASVSVAGAGTITIARVDADSFAATLVGEGAITAAGRAVEVRIIGNGPGTIDASNVVSERVAVQASGDVIVRAAARTAARITAGPDAQVSVAGRPQCAVRAAEPANIRCGVR
jgi:hypothetical protein